VDHVRYVWLRAIRKSSMRCVWCVGLVSPVGCTLIRIIVTLDISNYLSYGRRHIDYLMTLMVVYDGMVILNYLFANSCLISLDGSFS
jgi:hypothetical protein